MKEMIKTLINYGFNWVTKNSGGTEVFQNKPSLDKENNNFYDEEHWGLSNEIPDCLFPDINFENSPVELKTLLVDYEDKNSIEYKQQQEIRRLIDGNFDYIIREWNNKTIAVYKGDGGTTKTEHLCGLCPDKYKKVYLRDLIKKRKVKKSVWVGRSLTDYYLTVDGVAYSHTEKFPFEFLFQGRDKNVTEFELTYEVEE